MMDDNFLPARQRQSGNALFLILIAIALFGAITYAITRSGGGGASITREKALLDAARSEQCNASVEYTVNKLEVIGKCAANLISYELTDGTNENPLNTSDTSCFVFHTAGGGATPCGIYLGLLGCNLAALTAGQKCPSADIVFVGTSGGHRVYTTIADQGMARWKSGGTNTVTGATSATNGMPNTNTLVALADAGAPYDAAIMCRALGTAWYLPSRDELHLLYDEQNTGVLAGTFDQTGAQWFVDGSLDGYYWSSTEGDAGGAWDQRFDQDVPWNYGKNETLSVRCVRSD